MICCGSAQLLFGKFPNIWCQLGCGWLPAHVGMERTAKEPPAERGVEADPGEGVTATPGAGSAALRLDEYHAALQEIAWDAPTRAPRLAYVMVTWRP